MAIKLSPTILVSWSPEENTEPVEVVYAPVQDIRHLILEAAAKFAGSGSPGDMLISQAMFQMLPIIDKAYPPRGPNRA